MILLNRIIAVDKYDKLSPSFFQAKITGCRYAAIFGMIYLEPAIPEGKTVCNPASVVRRAVINDYALIITV